MIMTMTNTINRVYNVYDDEEDDYNDYILMYRKTKLIFFHSVMLIVVSPMT